jgi:hypothetical protein
MKTGVGKTWTKDRVYSVRHRHHLQDFDPHHPPGAVTLDGAAQRLGVSPASGHRLVSEKILPARLVVPYPPWEIPVDALDSEIVRQAVSRIKNRIRTPQTHIIEEQQAMFSGS